MSPNATIKLSPTKFVVAPANMAVDVTKKATKATLNATTTVASGALNATTTVASGALSATTFAGSGALKQVRHGLAAADEVRHFSSRDGAVTYQASYRRMGGDGVQPPHILKYDTRRVLFSPWKTIFTRDRRAVAGYEINGWSSLLRLLAIEAFGVYAAAQSHARAGSFHELAVAGNSFSVFMAFLLTGYLKSSLGKYQLCRDKVGAFWAMTETLTGYAGIWFSSGSREDRGAIAAVRRLSLLMYAISCKELIGDTSTDDLVAVGLATPEEAALLGPDAHAFRFNSVWAWHQRLWEDAFEGHLPGASRAPAWARKLVAEKLDAGKNACGGLFGTMNFQYPFSYLHLLSMLIDISLMISALQGGLAAGVEMRHAFCDDADDDDAIRCDQILTAVRRSSRSAATVAIVLASSVVRLVTQAFVYRGALSVAACLERPVGSDISDFPTLTWYNLIKGDSESIEASLEGLRRLASFQPASPRAAASPTKGAAPETKEA